MSKKPGKHISARWRRHSPDQPATYWACSLAPSLPSAATSAPSRSAAAAPSKEEWRLRERQKEITHKWLPAPPLYSPIGPENQPVPVLKPRPSAGHGLWFFHRFPRYQSLWFSTRPITCLSAHATNINKRVHSNIYINQHCTHYSYNYTHLYYIFISFNVAYV